MSETTNAVGFIFVYALFLFHHLRGATTERGPIFLMAFGGVLVIVMAAYFSYSTRGTVSFLTAMSLLFAYGSVLFVLLCNLLLFGLGKSLTKKRGEKWTKEIDYIYLLLGVLGILGTLNRIDGISGRVSQLELVAPAILTTAVVIRVIKTRAEIAGWNKLSFYE